MRILLLYTLLLCCSTLNAQVNFNGNFEQLDSLGKPLGWELSFNNSKSYEIKQDSIVKQQGKYSISITPGDGKESYGAINHPIHQTFHGKTLTLYGNIKTEKVSEGYAGLWLRVDGKEAQVLELNLMKDQGVTGTTDWKSYFIQVPYNETDAVTINAGALLSGKGKMWIDNMWLFLDSNLIEKAPLEPASLAAIRNDTSFLKGSGIVTLLINQQNTVYLTLLGQVWGFLKYHHPAIARGDYNWDAELFRILPQILNCTTNAQVSDVFENWVDRLGKPALCVSCSPLLKGKEIAVVPDYGILFNNTVFSQPLINKLKYILANRNIAFNYYVEVGGKPVFHEKAYKNIEFPDAGYRLLSLYRYWNMIQYFYPSRELITEGWNNLLPKFIPEFVCAENATDYTKTVVKLIASIHDTHAWVISKVLDDFQGNYRVPFQARFIENKLTVTGYYSDTLDVKAKFKMGDVIMAINGIKVTELIKKNLPLTSASNYATQLRDMPGGFLLRSKTPQFSFKLIRDNKVKYMDCRGVELSKLNFFWYDFNRDAKAPDHYIIDKQIGYIFAGRYKNKNLADIKKKFADTKGIIVDMRCYPSDELESTFGNYIKPFSSPFIQFTKGSVSNPGSFEYCPYEYNGEKCDSNYKGKVVIIVNAMTQSNAEFVTMAFQSDPHVTVIGSTTAGADGNISEIILPCGISTNITGLGVYYPDGTNAQRKGVKIDHFIEPTLQGVKNGRDELLEKAKDIIMNN